jgi:RNA polymerase sigma factor (sigma-70 family)
MLVELSDAELLADGSSVRFGVFYERHVDAVAAFLGGRVRSPELVFDLVAETFARALERCAQFDPGRGPAVGWLFTIARNLMIDSARRGQVASDSRVRLGMAPVALDEDQLELVHERSEMDLRSALAGMPADQREAVVRRVVLEQSYPEIAEDLRCSQQVARKRVSRGLAALRRTLEEQR